MRCRKCNEEKLPEQFKSKTTLCKQCYNADNRRYAATSRSKPFGAAKRAWDRLTYRCGNRNGDFPLYASIKLKFTYDRFMAWAVPAYEIWLSANPGMTPSINRIDPTGHYAPGNVEIVSLNENSRLSNITRKNRTVTVEQLAVRFDHKCRKLGIAPSAVAQHMLSFQKTESPAAVSGSGALKVT